MLFQAFGLRGTIRDGGILCSCAFCKGCRVRIENLFTLLTPRILAVLKKKKKRDKNGSH